MSVDNTTLDSNPVPEQEAVSVKPITVYAITDSDSYVKWAAATLDQLGEPFHSRILVVHSPIAPSTAQVEAALAGTRFSNHVDAISQTLTVPALTKVLKMAAPDVLFLAGTGPMLEVVSEVAQKLPHPPAMISGIPGMALPARFKGIEFRARAHAFIVHSKKEAAEYGALLREKDVDQSLVLTHLPFLPPRRPAQKEPLNTIVFTPQALVPAASSQRLQVLKALAATKKQHPQLRIVVKLRALAGEQQTHNEAFPYDVLWDQAYQEDNSLDRNALSFETGPLSEFLVPGAAHVTVSSTAALESLSAGIPTLILNDFGVNERLLNAVYAQSGCVGSLQEIQQLLFAQPDQGWLQDNYFHSEPSQLSSLLQDLAEQRRSGELRVNEPLNFKARKRRLIRNYARSTLPQGLFKAVTLILRVLPGKW